MEHFRKEAEDKTRWKCGRMNDSFHPGIKTASSHCQGLDGAAYWTQEVKKNMAGAAAGGDVWVVVRSGWWRRNLVRLCSVASCRVSQRETGWRGRKTRGHKVLWFYLCPINPQLFRAAAVWNFNFVTFSLTIARCHLAQGFHLVTIGNI